MSRILVLVILPLLLTYAFQNCTRVDFGKTPAVEKLKSSSNGENYDGKVFVHADTLHPCDDLTLHRSIIVLTPNNEFLLVKKDCADILPPQPLAATDVQIDPTYPALLSSQGSRFIFDASSIPTPPDLSCVRKNIGPVDSLKIYSVDSPQGPMLTGIAMVYGSPVNFAFDQTVLDTSATGNLFAIDQENASSLSLYNFDASAQLPDNTNTQYQYGKGPLGSTAYLSCVRPGGTL